MRVASVVVGPCPSYLPTNPLLRPPEPIKAGARPRLTRRVASQTHAVTSTPAATPIAEMVGAMLSGGRPVEVVVLAVGTVELARPDIVPSAERRRAFDRDRKRRASKAPPAAEGQHAPPPPELHEKSSVVAKPFAFHRGTRITDNLIPDEKWLPSSENNRVVP